MKPLIMTRAVLLILTFPLWMGCSQQKKETRNYGQTQGTTYSVTYLSEDGFDYQSQIDSILIAIDKSMSLWLDHSIISRINSGEENVVPDEMFVEVFKRAQEISRLTKGNFDVSVSPLVNAYGFGPGEAQSIDSSTVDSLKALVDYKKLNIKNGVFTKAVGQQIDFNAVAQGYSVDRVASFLSKKGMTDYLVEIGGELKTAGLNAKGKVWKIGIDKPQEEIDKENRFQIIVGLSGKSLATSGNYRKFKTDHATGKRFVHTINPKSGYPVRSALLSTSIITDACMDADAYATACMVMGVNGAMDLIDKNPYLEGYLIYVDHNGDLAEWKSKGFSAFTD